MDIPALARRFAAVFPHLDPRTGRIAVTLYRLLSAGRPVPWSVLSAATGEEEARLQSIVRAWPAVDEEQAGVSAFGGLCIHAVSPHRLRIGRHMLYTRCAWDGLFIPGVLGVQAEVLSSCAATGVSVSMMVTPDGLRNLRPQTALLSMLEPTEDMVADLTQHF